MARVRTDNVWKRNERNGWMSILPLEGQRAFDATIINPTAKMIVERLQSGESMTSVLAQMTSQYDDVDPDRIRQDLLGVVKVLTKLDMFDFDDEELASLVAAPAVVRPGARMLGDRDLPSLVNFMRDAANDDSADSRVRHLYRGSMSMGSYSDISFVRMLHFYNVISFIGLFEQDGRMTGCISVYQMASPSPVVTIASLTVAGDHEDERHDRANQLVAALERFAAALAMTKVRLCMVRDDQDQLEQLEPTEAPPCSADDPMMALLSASGYRREAVLEDEAGPGVDFVYFSKNLIQCECVQDPA